jgi:anti-sigma B factor antagonist
MSLTVKVEKRAEGVYTVIPNGRIDSETCFLFEEKIKPVINAGTKALILDMADLDYINSSGLGVIFYAKKNIENSKGTFLLMNLQPQIKKVFEIVKALPETPIFKNIEEVDEYLDVIQQKEIEKKQTPPKNI